MDINKNNVLHKLLNNIDETNSIGLKARKSIVNKFNKKVLIPKINDLYNNI